MVQRPPEPGAAPLAEADLRQSRNLLSRRLLDVTVLNPGALALLIVSGLGALVSVHLGQDANWDLRNYHLYNAYAFANGREAVDAAPAGLQSYLSPLADLPYYYMAALWLPTQPRLVAAIQGLYFGLLIFAIFRINRRVFAERSRTALSLAVGCDFHRRHGRRDGVRDRHHVQ